MLLVVLMSTAALGLVALGIGLLVVSPPVPPARLPRRNSHQRRSDTTPGPGARAPAAQSLMATTRTTRGTRTRRAWCTRPNDCLQPQRACGTLRPVLKTSVIYRQQSHTGKSQILGGFCETNIKD
jgi:hypothetical protein